MVFKYLGRTCLLMKGIREPLSNATEERNFDRNCISWETHAMFIYIIYEP